MDHCLNEKGNPVKYTTVEINPSKDVDLPLNINITAEILLRMKNLIDAWVKSLSSLDAQVLDETEAMIPYNSGFVTL